MYEDNSFIINSQLSTFNSYSNLILNFQSGCMKLFSFITKKNKKYTLVISWWWTRGFYGLWVLKWLEELWFKDKITAMYGVSAWAMLVSYRAAGYDAQTIYEKFIQTKNIFSLTALNIFPKKSLLKSSALYAQFQRDLPPEISSLPIKVYIGTTDVDTGKYKLFSQGNLPKIILGSISIPGIFPVVAYEGYTLMDGGVTNNFPVDIAKQKYPKNEIIGIALNRFKENQKISNIVDTLSVAFEILLRSSMLENFSLVNHLFYNSIPIKVLDRDTRQMKKAYEQGYKDCMAHFQSSNI